MSLVLPGKGVLLKYDEGMRRFEIILDELKMKQCLLAQLKKVENEIDRLKKIRNDLECDKSGLYKASELNEIL